MFNEEDLSCLPWLEDMNFVAIVKRGRHILSQLVPVHEGAVGRLVKSMEHVMNSTIRQHSAPLCK